jgi:hypothetical protein
MRGVIVNNAEMAMNRHLLAEKIVARNRLNKRAFRGLPGHETFDILRRSWPHRGLKPG